MSSIMKKSRANVIVLTTAFVVGTTWLALNRYPEMKNKIWSLLPTSWQVDESLQQEQQEVAEDYTPIPVQDKENIIVDADSELNEISAQDIVSIVSSSPIEVTATSLDELKSWLSSVRNWNIIDSHLPVNTNFDRKISPFHQVPLIAILFLLWNLFRSLGVHRVFFAWNLRLIFGLHDLINRIICR